NVVVAAAEVPEPFVSVDPLVTTTFDPYGYAGGNPLQNVDPLGLDWEDPFWAAVRGAADVSAGLGDTLTFGGTKAIRQALDLDAVNYCSTAYAVGTYTAVAVSFAVPVPGLGAFAAAARVATVVRKATTAVRTAAGAIAQRWRTLAPQLRSDTGAITIGPSPRFVTTGSGLTVDRTAVASRVAQTQGRHIVGHPNYNGGGYFNSLSDAQRVLDEFHSGAAQVLGVKRNGDIVVRSGSVTGFNNNARAGFLNQPTDVFFIKGTSSPSVVPYNPMWTP
ncbi:MAG: polymorphic toxin type 50 domain-containing protein, partial [Micrococcales bacterium]|nr:polymorphic toxin type 50 domain-containing protein [Micrococcales bacterium]